jgi:6-phosphogluconolactonase
MTTRRKFLAGLAVAPWGARILWAKAKGDSSMLFVGTGTNTGSKGIYGYHFDPEHGSLEQIGLAAPAPSPSFLALSPDGEFLFAVNEIDTYHGGQSGEKTGAVSSYLIDKAAGKLKLISTVSSGGAGPCHLNTDNTGRVLIVANYSGGSASSFQIAPDGHLSEAVSNFHYASNGAGPGQDKERQEASHAHHAAVSPNNRFVYINDLGLDCIHIYRLDPQTAKLTPNEPKEWKDAVGAGPRVLRFHPNGRWAYCVNELASTINLLQWDGSNGGLNLIDTTDLLPEGFHGISRSAEIIFNKQGHYAYAANRDNDFLATFHIDPATGKLSSLRRTPCGGSIPRHVALDPSEHWILVANQESNLIAVYRRDPKSGKLAVNGPTFPIQSPQCLLFV